MNSSRLPPHTSNSSSPTSPAASPLERVEALYLELVAHYGDGDQRELRAAAKLLLVALARFRTHGGPDWARLLDEYVVLAKTDPARFERLLSSNRSEPHDGIWA
ncbi:hypothetical protein Thiowin_00692 [Thiorhodovibrio winogradskyi]|uniref:Uncharacterized protein n=1 Tax=Thiorhodovibrio winogradskyi TaxID=77007 RepID=A0ABZ0S8F2_9GAMM|nr:hypothetical protein [Thiorhodovibrio winogradskyi]